MAKQLNPQMRVSKHSDVFTLVKQNNGIIIVVGEYKVCDKTFTNFNEAENYIASKPYKLIFNTFQIFMHYAKDKQTETVNKETAKE